MGEFIPKQPSVDFKQVARKFITAGGGRVDGREGYVAQISEGLRNTDERLKNSDGDLILMQYYKGKHIVYRVGRTNGEGIKVTKNSETGQEQLEFGKNAVIQQTIMGDTGTDTDERTLTAQEALIVPSGFSLDMFTPAGRIRELQIGDQAIKGYIRYSGVSQNAWIAFMLEQAGIDTEAFLNDYFYPTIPNPHGGRPKFESDLRQELHGFREVYGTLADVPEREEGEGVDTETEVDHSVNVQPITNFEGELLIGDAGSYEDLGGKVNPSVFPTEQLINQVQSHMRKSGTAFYLSWRGSIVPHGATINGVEIGYTQHGMVKDTEGNIIGTYSRLNENGGDTNDEQEIVVFIDPSVLKSQ